MREMWKTLLLWLTNMLQMQFEDVKQDACRWINIETS